MTTNRFFYQILRYIPDLNRMEPRNFGIIVQGGGHTKVKINTRFAQKGFVDTEAFRSWRRFLEKEIDEEQTEQLSFLRPAKDSPEFLDHLNQLVKGNFNLSRPLVAEYRRDVETDTVLYELFEALVSDKEEQDAVMITRPTGKFRASSDEKQFLKRGLRKDEHVKLGENTEWIGYRFYVNGKIELIEKVEFNREPRRTAEELNSLIRLIPTIPDSFTAQGNRFHLILDPHKMFPNQKEDEAEKYRMDRERLGKMAADVGIRIYDTPENVQPLIDEIDGELPQLKEAANF
jgi:hypothetical protein